jgi:hypothetical protein
MDGGKKQAFPMQFDGNPNGQKLKLTVDECLVTLNFPPKAQGVIMTEVKRMILSGHSRTRV